MSKLLLTIALGCALVVVWKITNREPTPATPAPVASTRERYVDRLLENLRKQHNEEKIKQAAFQAENDKWLDERDEFTKRCYLHGGVPVFTFGMRLFCISRSVVIEGGLSGPNRSAPERE